MTSTTDSTFTALPHSLQHRIDAAFTLTYNAHFAQAEHQPAPGPGGFLPPSPPAFGGGGGGGFLPPSPSPASAEDGPTHIPLRLVPTALRRLSLPPADPEILAVFRTAADGWARPAAAPSALSAPEAEAEAETTTTPDEQWVARADWRSVCAVLLEGEDTDEDENEDDGYGYGPASPSAAPSASSDVEIDIDVGSSDALSSGSGSSDEFRLAPQQKRGKRTSTRASPSPRTRRSKLSSTSAAAGDRDTPLTAHQLSTALDAFALFFPSLDASMDADDLATQRLRADDVQRAARVLGETIKADELHNMLTLFSTAPDGSLGLADFARMMVAAGLA